MKEDSSVENMEKKIRASSSVSSVGRGASSSSSNNNNDLRKQPQQQQQDLAASNKYHHGNKYRNRENSFDNRQKFSVGNPARRAVYDKQPRVWKAGNLCADQRPQNREVKTVSQDLSNRKKRSGGDEANYLLNFSYGERESLNGPPVRRKNWARMKNKMSKEQFLQANCQFVLKSDSVISDFSSALADPDKLVDWDTIEQVRLYDQQLASCPICLEVPTAAQMTKCAHIYCWPCILHYLSLSDKSWAACPICHDMVSETDLKSVLSLPSPRYNVGDLLSLRLMKRERGSTYVRPVDNWTLNSDGNIFSLNDGAENVRYSKLLIASCDDILTLIEEQRGQLLNFVQRDDTEALEASFAEAVLSKLQDRESKLAGQKSTQTSVHANVLRDESAETVVENKPAMISANAITYSDAFDEEVASTPSPTLGEKNITQQSDPIGVDTTHEQITPVVSPPRSRARSSASTSSCEGGEVDQMVHELVLPPTGTQPGSHAGGGNKRKDVYYFYQAADGQHVYLHSLNARILAAQYGSLDLAPRTITATIVEMESTSMTTDARQRLKYLSHLPLHCQYAVVELALRPPLVSSKTLSMFHDEIEKRKKVRNRRQRVEKQQQRKADAEERRRMGKFPDLNIPLNSEHHFPEAPPTFNLEASFPVSTEETTDEQVKTEDLNATFSDNIDGTTPYSFAQAMKQQTVTPNWPRAKQVQSSISQGSSTPSAEGQDEDEGAAPAYKDSFGAAIDQALSKLSTEEKGSSGGRSARKKKQRTLLFSTAQRANI